MKTDVKAQTSPARVVTMAKEWSGQIAYSLIKTLRNPHLWAVAVIVFLLVFIHYYEIIIGVPFLERVGSILGLGLTRHTLERTLFLIPIAYGTAVFGLGGGLSILVLAAAAMFPRVFLVSPAPREALFETCGVIFTGLLIILLFDALQKGKQRLTELETAQSMLSLQLERLGLLHVISGITSQSLELNQVLAIIDKVKQLMHAEASWLYLYDEESGKLRLAASSGLTKGTMPASLKIGEDLDGMVAQSKEPVVIDDVSADAKFKSTMDNTGLQSVLVVPLIGKGRVVPLIGKGKVAGTLGVGNNLARHLPPDEVDLLHAIADQISMAIDNSRLYERERAAAEALRISERNYRELFENASDAVWVHDLNGKILAVNSAFERLTGYERDALIGANVSLFLSSHSLSKVDKEAHDVLLRGGIAVPHEQELIKKDKSTAIIQIGTSLITSEGEPWAFQHVARDITEEKRIQDNLRSYVQQVSQAQEAERKRIARELHDETAQALVAVVRNLEDVAAGHTRLTLNDIREQIRNILQGVRHFSQQLRPSILDDLGLLPAVKWLVSDLTNRSGIDATVKVQGQPHQLAPDAELMLFRITQEALNNIQKHSEANKVCVTVEFIDHSTKLTVSDNGKGFEMPERVGDLARSGKLGLAGMQERAQLLGGNLTIESKRGQGTTLTVKVPL